MQRSASFVTRVNLIHTSHRTYQCIVCEGVHGWRWKAARGSPTGASGREAEVQDAARDARWLEGWWKDAGWLPQAGHTLQWQGTGWFGALAGSEVRHWGVHTPSLVESQRKGKRKLPNSIASGSVNLEESAHQRPCTAHTTLGCWCPSSAEGMPCRVPNATVLIYSTTLRS